MEDFSAFNEVYSQYFTKKPARTTFAAKGLARNAKVEIDVIAAK
jgi:2-iminobutanoate/2-iminopropanoate deaminase